MKKGLILCLTMAVILMGLVGCTSNELGTTSNRATVEVSIDDFMNVNSISREVEVVKGGTVTVILGSNQTTGFQWSEDAVIGDTTILEQTNHKYVSPEADNQVVGAAGNEQWTFKALKAGTTTVAMEYSRPWEGGEKGAWKFNLTITVQP